MNSISAPNRFNSIPYGSESQDKATHGQPSRKLMAMKVGAAALCGAALAGYLELMGMQNGECWIEPKLAH